MITWWDDFKAWRRGERRIAPAGVRGRIYAKRDGKAPAGPQKTIKTKTTFRVTARVIRADGRPDEHYNITEG